MADESSQASLPSAPREPPPPGACDTHAHVFGPFERYPLIVELDYTPPLAPAERYLAMLDRLGLERGVLVHSTAQSLDNRVTLDALDSAPERLRGTAVVEPSVAPETLTELSRHGFRSLRFTEMQAPDGRQLFYVQRFDALAQLAPQLRDLGWHAQLWAPCATLVARAPELLEHGVALVFDHMGLPDVERGVGDRDFEGLLDLLSSGEVWIKVPPQRPSHRFPDYEDVRPFFDALVEARPDRLVWGSDWPHLHSGDRTPDGGHLLDLLREWTADEALLRAILVENPQALFGFPAV